MNELEDLQHASDIMSMNLSTAISNSLSLQPISRFKHWAYLHAYWVLSVGPFYEAVESEF
jgi:hypothetical protein